MPKYLAPGVYVEEFEIGAKPIEGVSTSTAGFLGYAERGPLNKPTLVTSFADFERIFGGFLPAQKDDSNGNSYDLSKIRWLAYAVSAFFENGGKRAYITRVAGTNAQTASGFLPKQPEGTPPTLDEDVQANAIVLKLNPGVPEDWKDKDVLFLKDGAQSEYLEYKGRTKALTLDHPLIALCSQDTDLIQLEKDATKYGLAEKAGQKTQNITLAPSGPGKDKVILIWDTGDSKNSEISYVEDVDAGDDKQLTLRDELLHLHEIANTEIYLLEKDATTYNLAEKADQKAQNIMLTASGVGMHTSILIWDTAKPENFEISYVEGVDAGDDKQLTLRDELLHLHEIANTEIYLLEKDATTYSLAERAEQTKNITLAAGPGKDKVILIVDTGDSKNSEISYVEEVVLDDDKKQLTLRDKLLHLHEIANTEIYLLNLPTNPKKINPLINVPEESLVIPVASNDTEFSPDTYIKLKDEYYIIIATDVEHSILIAPPLLKYNHTALKNKDSTTKDKKLLKLDAAIKIKASSEGTWGNSIKVAVTPSSLCIAKLTLAPNDSKRLDLNTINGIEPGSLLRLPEEANPQYVIVEKTAKTAAETFIILKSDFTGSLKKDDVVQTEEFDLHIMDGKNEEVFKSLSLNDNHSRYITNIITEKSSNLIRIGELAKNSDVIVMPTPDDMPGWLLTEGKDGFPIEKPGSIIDPGQEEKYYGEIKPIYEGQPNVEPDKRTGLYKFQNIDDINIVAIPGITSSVLQQKLITHCEVEMNDRFAVLDPIETADLDQIKAQRNLFDTSYAALYYPWVYAYDPLSKEYINVPPSGYVCGIYARTDVERGVHKAPANEKINGVVNLEKLNGSFRMITQGSQEILSPLGINCIRIFPGRGIRVWGARTVSSNTLWKYINVRRLFLYVEESIEKGTQWVVFEPNNEKLWARVRATITQFLTQVWRGGALMGTKVEEAFFVKCDRTTMTQSDIDNGRLICVIGIALVKPAEFVIFRIAQWQGGSAATE